MEHSNLNNSTRRRTSTKQKENAQPSSEWTDEKVNYAIQFAQHAERLGFDRTEEYSEKGEPIHSSGAIEAKFITPQDPIVLTADGSRLPAIPVDEALELNRLRDKVDGRDPRSRSPAPEAIRISKDGTIHGRGRRHVSNPSAESDSSLHDSLPPSRTNPLFPALPLYGPPTFLRNCQSWSFRISASIGSFGFLLIVLLGALFTSIPAAVERTWMRIKGQDPAERRPFFDEEERRERERQKVAAAWAGRQDKQQNTNPSQDKYPANSDHYVPTEGGEDPLVCDPAYYARRVGLDMEEYKVQTEDGFIIDLWHVYDPKEYSPAPAERRARKTADIFQEGYIRRGREHGTAGTQYSDGNRRYPVLLMHGLLQSYGTYCCNDDDSYAFYLVKAGYDVWLGNNRCGLWEPEHVRLQYGDPRMWAWNIRQMGCMDLPALISRVLEEAGFEKLGLICHSQGTTQTLVALAKEQRPDIGLKISVFCGLAPAAYSGPLIRKGYFKFMSILTPSMFRLVFGIHSFIPLMMVMHKLMPGKLYGDIGYLIFSFLFDWTDIRWDRRLRPRLFQMAPVYVSAESMRWWLGRDCFAKQKCILSTRREGELEDEEDEEEDYSTSQHPKHSTEDLSCHEEDHHHKERGRYSWYDEKAPPMAFWVGGNDHLVNGRRLLRRFERGREPHVDVVFKKVIDTYEHLDVIWAIDAIEKVGRDMKKVIWQTVSAEDKALCRTPTECENIGQWTGDNSTDKTVIGRSGKGDMEKGKMEKQKEDGADLPEP